MYGFTEHQKIFIALQPIDFRKRLEGTLAVCRQQLQQNPLSGHVFVFRNQRATTVRLIFYEHHGFWWMEKRLSQGRFRHWPTSSFACALMTRTQLYHLLENSP